MASKITHLDRALLFKDDTFFHVPDDFRKTEYHDDDDDEVRVLCMKSMMWQM